MLPEIGMGCWAIGGVGYGPVSDKEAFATLEAAWGGGVRFFDTADTYGEGRSESLLGSFLSSRSRDDMILATKAGWDFYPSTSSGQVRGGHRKNFDSDYLKFACEQSLKRLKTNFIDLYQLHNPSLQQIQAGEAVSALSDLKKEGKIGHIGISVHTEEEAMAALRDERVEVLQLIFNLLDQRMAKNVFFHARMKKVGILVREPLASGWLGGAYDESSVFPKEDHRRRFSKEKLKTDVAKTEKIKAILKGKNLPIAALEFILAQEEVGCVIPGAKKPEQMGMNLCAAERSLLTETEVESLKRLFSSDPLFWEHLIPAK